MVGYLNGVMNNVLRESDTIGQTFVVVQRQWPTKCKQRLRCIWRVLPLLFFSAIISVGSSLFSLGLTVNDHQDLEPLGQQPPNSRKQVKYPRPRYKISQADDFLQCWRASHTYNFTKLTIGSKYKSNGTAIPIGRERQGNNRPPKMLLGIITLAESRDRRELIRQTYLNYYKDMKTLRHPSTLLPSHKLCSIRHLDKDCQIAYVFVAAGGSSESPVELMHSNASLPLTVSGPPENQDEDDIIYLNVREHMNQGKIPTWFKYALTISHPDVEFDYLAKVDDDTLLFTGNLMDVLERDLLKPQLINADGLVYGGTINHVLEVWKGRDCLHGTTWDDCPIYGPVWMIGPVYFLSRNLADYITSDVVDRKALTHVEDVSTASFVWSHPGSVTVLEIPRSFSLMSYDYGSDRGHRQVWNKYARQIYGHSEDACWALTEAYFKRPWNVRKIWREYLLWNWSGQTTAFKYRYQLHDFPPSLSSKKKAKPSSSTLSSSKKEVVVVHHSDYIYASDDFDASPIVVEAPYNMVFFPVTGVADIAWRCLIRRLLGYPDWDNTTRQLDGLKYLSDFDIPTASAIMSSENFTRVMFVRNPLHRIQHNYLKLVLDDEKNNHAMVRGCNCSRDCGDWTKEEGPCQLEKKSFTHFLALLVQSCDQPYWRPMSRQMEPRYKKKLNFIGTYESISDDADKLFRKLLNLGPNTTIAEALGWSESLQEHFERFDEEYQPSEAPHVFRGFWGEAFATIYRFDLSSTYWKYNVTLPSGMSRTKSRKKLKKKKVKIH